MVDPAKLEQEADELYKQAMSPPETDTGAAAVEQPPQVSPAKESAATKESPAESVEAESLTINNAEERIRNAQARMTVATQEAADLRRESAALKQEHARLQAMIEQRQQEKPSPAKAADTDKPDTLEALAEDYPEIIKPMIVVIGKLQSEINQLKQQTGEAVTIAKYAGEKIAATEAKGGTDAFWSAVEASHPDAREVAASDDFKGFVARQPPSIQQMYYNQDANDAAWLLNSYKQTMPPAKPAETKHIVTEPKLPTARSPPLTGNRPSFTREQIQNMSMDEFLKNEKEIDAAVAAGLL